jgi:hypothetical protein
MNPTGRPEGECRCAQHAGRPVRAEAWLPPGASCAATGAATTPARRKALVHCALTVCALLAGCESVPSFPPAAPTTGKRKAPVERDFVPSDLAKSDVDVALEVPAEECLASARLLMEKLYRRNPRELRKGNHRSIGAALGRAFNTQAGFRFAELADARGADAIMLGLKPDYAGDRVFAYGVGLASMVYISHNEKTQFYMTDTLDPQKLYNCARNIEIAAWKLAHAHGAHGEPLLLSNEMGAGAPNLSFEREFGKMIGYQDLMARIAAQRTNRIIRRIVQNLATAVFLPV